MGVKGLTTFLSKNPSSYNDIHLHNTTIVIDLCNFASHLYAKAAMSQYTGEYLDYAAECSLILLNFKLCKIEPIFIIDGSHEPDNEKFDELIRRRYNSMQELKEKQNLSCISDDSQMNMQMMPKLAMEVIVRQIQDFDHKCITLDYESDSETSALAAILGCPVVSGDSDFYCFNHSIVPSRGYCFIPLPLFNTDIHYLERCDCNCINPSYLSVKYYCHDRSPLRNLPLSFLPLLSSIIGNDTLSPRLPKAIFRKMDDLKSRPMSNPQTFSHRRLVATIEWLETNQNNPSHILEQLTREQDDMSRHEFIKLMNYSFRQYFIPTHLIAPYILPLLSIETQQKLQVRYTSLIPASDISINALQQFLTGAFPEFYNHFGITSSWPTGVVKLFRESGFNQTLLDALYTKNGVTFRSYYEDVLHSISSAAIALPFRKIFYAIFCFIEPNPSKLVGMNNENIVHETFLQGMKIFKGDLKIEYQKDYPIACSFLQLLENRFNFQSELLSNDEPWLNFAICLLVFHMASSDYKSSHIDLQRVSDITLCIIIATHINLIESEESRWKQLAFIAEKYSQFADSMDIKRPLDFVLNMISIELQALYQILKFIYALCGTLQCPSQKISVETGVNFFPSGRLFHFLYHKKMLPEIIFSRLIEHSKFERSLSLYNYAKIKTGQILARLQFSPASYSKITLIEGKN
ncbi:Protein asteroid 1 [Cichlidogyrus casuarinus]|uniref:Protein asteroid 1 n=1 Tax=Cichlidogyrus casuarinus TaxID=1844966 RepID=A0ABD2Q2D7_9PLAT